MNMTHSVAKFRILDVMSEIHCKLHICHNLCDVTRPKTPTLHLPFAYKLLVSDKRQLTKIGTI